MTINPDAKKWVILTAVSVLAVVFMCWACWNGGSGSASRAAKKQYQQDMKRLQFSFDSLSAKYQQGQRRYDSLGQQQQFLAARDSVIAAQVRRAKATVSNIQKQYEALRRYDTLGTVDISRYLSDSLP